MLVEVDDVQERGEVMAPLSWEGEHTEWGIIFLDGVGKGLYFFTAWRNLATN